MKRRPIPRKLSTFTLLALVGAATAVPTAQAGTSGTTVNDAAAIHARWHNAGYGLHSRPGANLPAGFARHKGSVQPRLETTTVIRGATVADTGSSGFGWTSFAIGTAFSIVLALAALAGTRMVRGRRLATS